MMKNPVARVSRLACISALILAPAMSQAGEIALTFPDNGITISGEFAGFQDNAYVVATSTGELHVPASYVTCEGIDCLIIVTASN